MGRATIIGLLWLLAAVPVAFAQSGPSRADLQTIKGCLERQEERLGTECVGLIAHPCIAASGGALAESSACAAREQSVWDSVLSASLRRVRAGGFKEVTDAVTRAQTSWQASRAIFCAVFDKTDPGMLPGGAGYCRMHETAYRALLVRRLGDAVNPH
jgi:hypothetical protein